MTSQQIDQLVREEPIRAASHLREVFIPGTFGSATADLRPMGALESTLFRGEAKLREVLAVFENAEERGLCDDLTTLIDRVIDRMGEVALQGDDAA